jgi:hypothetical protein
MITPLKCKTFLIALSAGMICLSAWPNDMDAAGDRSKSFPVPFYALNVIKTEKYSAGTVILTTKDSVDTVCVWYRKNLADQNGEKVTEDGAHIFSTHNGSTVDVEPGNRFAPGTTVSLSWDTKKYGEYQAN